MMLPPQLNGAWALPCALLVTISFFITLLVHMVSRAFNLPSLALWAKSEYSQVAVSVLLLAFALGMSQVGGSIVGNITAVVSSASGNVVLEKVAGPDADGNTHVDDPVYLAKEYLLQGPLACERAIYQIVLALAAIIDPINSITFSVGNVEGVGAGFFLQGYSSLFHYAAHNIAYLALFHYLQYNVLLLSQYAMLQMFLPIGLGLRMFAPTRGAGGLMVAFALGFAFVFPMSYVLIVAMMPSTDFVCTDVVAQGDASPLNGVEPCFTNAGAQMEVKYALEADTSRDRLEKSVWHAIDQLYLQAFFYPMVALIITFSFVRQTGSLFGADLGEIGRGLIKII